MRVGGVLRYVLCYDVPDDRRRSRLARVLEAYGNRVQYSVFEALLDRRLLAELLSKVEPLLERKEDTLRIYPLCSTCVQKQVKLGVGASDIPPGEEVVFVV